MTKGRILVVDDEPQIRRVLRATLTAQGYEVVDARTGEDALDRAARQPLPARSARHEHARHRRPRNLPRDPRHQRGLGHHAHRPRLRARQGGRARRRRRRLHHQTLRHARTARAHPRRAAPSAPARHRRGRIGLLRRSGVEPRHAPHHPRGPGAAPHAAKSSTCSSTCSPTPTCPCRTRVCSRPSGAPTTATRSNISASSSTRSARSSNPTRHTRAISSPSPGSATASSSIRAKPEPAPCSITRASLKTPRLAQFAFPSPDRQGGARPAKPRSQAWRSPPGLPCRDSSRHFFRLSWGAATTSTPDQFWLRSM